jgi:hypothetical protein
VIFLLNKIYGGKQMAFWKRNKNDKNSIIDLKLKDNEYSLSPTYINRIKEKTRVWWRSQII